MNIAKSIDKELGRKIVLEEFRFWDAKRNNLPEEHLNVIQKKIDELQFELLRSNN